MWRSFWRNGHRGRKPRKRRITPVRRGEVTSMDILDRDTVLELARHVGWPAVSIYLPTHPGHAESTQDQLRLKNLVRNAADELLAGGLKQQEVDALLARASEMLGDGSVWRATEHGIAAFYAEDTAYAYLTPVPMPERASVADRFVIRPLLSAIEAQARYFVLAISQKQLRVFEGAHNELTELDASGMPASLAEALRFDDFEKHVTFHTRTPASASGKDSGRRAASFHGHGGIPDVAKKNIERYFRMVNSGMADLLHGEQAPLIIAGVDFLVPIYREVNSYPHLTDEVITGNPDELTAHQLGVAASDLLEPLAEQAAERDMAIMDEAGDGNGGSKDLAEIVTAAHEGRVRALFVSADRSDWGEFDPSSGTVRVHDERQPGDWDLTDLAAAETLLHGGDVYATERESAASAIFRY